MRLIHLVSREFYIQRAKRLLPAAYASFFAVALLAQFFLTSRELADFEKQLIGAITITGNIVLWRQTGYFEGSAELKPLLHVWSLAIEEQYYLLIPALLVMSPRRIWTISSVLVCVLSIAACLLMGQFKPAATFFLLPTRSWELAIGSAGAFLAVGTGTRALLLLLFWPSVLMLVVAPMMQLEKGPPGLLTLFVCVSTLVVILRCHPVFDRSPFWNGLAKIGNISYSIYLVHWPIFAFINNSWVGEISYLVRIFCIGLSIAIAYFLYTYVEKPMRQYQIVGNHIKPGLIAISLTLALTMISFWSPRSSFINSDYEFIRRVNHGFGKACEYNANFSPKAECRNSDHPEMLVWGDSFAMHLVPGLAETNQSLGMIQATRSVCGPMLGLAPLFKKNSDMYQKGYTRTWSENCIAFNTSVIDYLRQAPFVKFVVLSSPFGQYLNSNADTVLDSTIEGFVERRAALEAALVGLKRTVDAVRSLGKRVVVVAPPPAAGFDIGVCLERLATHKVSFGQFSDCRVPISVYHAKFKSVLEFLDELPLQVGVAVICFDNVLCGLDFCRTLDGNTFLYRDGGHLSYAGSRALAKEMGLSELVQLSAR